MQVIFPAVSEIDFDLLLSEDIRSDYVYMYPPRQAYGAVDLASANRLVEESLAAEDTIDLYLHFPFCRQICAFCNLYAIGAPKGEGEDEYIEVLLQELASYADILKGKVVTTLYLGGGTPSMLSAEGLHRVLQAVEATCGTPIGDIPEVSIEASVDSFDPVKFREFRRIGINRVNVGLQSSEDAELALVGRAHEQGRGVATLRALQEISFDNICVDLIYGLQGQSDASWISSLETIIALRPETICAYAITLRPLTGYAKKGYDAIGPRTLYARYDMAVQRLRAAGYEQENHVRFRASKAGGYVQKANHWAGRNVLGVGAGARSYLKAVDLRNGYSARNRKEVYKSYFARIRATGRGYVDGFVMSPDEVLRKRIILGLFDLDLDAVCAELGVDPVVAFADVFRRLEEADAIEWSDRRVRLTPIGARHRDVIAQMFFSGEVSRRLESFSYAE